MTYQQKVGLGVRHRRIDCQMYQKDLGAKIGWNPVQISRFERGLWQQIDLQVLCRLATVLGVSVDNILRVEESDNA